MRSSYAFGVFLCGTLAAAVLAFQEPGGCHLLRKVSLGPAEGGGEYFDCITFDVASGRVYLFDLKTLKPIGQVKVDRDADSILYDPFSKRIFCFNGEPNSATVIDPATGAVVSTLALGGAPEPAVADGKGMIFDNLEDKNEVIAIDSRTLKITARWPVAPAGQPVSIAMDRQRRARLGTFRLLIYGR
jgi:DNA-binding beta-propeller fold protein YncE